MRHGKKILLGTIVLLLMAAASTALIMWAVENMPKASVTEPKRI